MAKKQMTRCSITIVRKCKFKPHETSIRTIKMKKPRSSVALDVKTRTHTLLVESELVQTHWKIGPHLLKLKIWIPYDLAIPLLYK